MGKNLVSIIVPIYNAERFLNETIDTIENQTYTDWELILVNDCSKDKSLEIIEKRIKKNSNIKVVNLEKNLGVANARNKGIDVARGNFICFIDADDLWKKEKLEKQIEFMKKMECAFSFTGYEFANEKGIGNGKVVKVPQKMKYKDALKNTIIFTSTVMFNMEKISKEEIKMEKVKSEDTATWWRILRNSYIAYGLNENLTYYRRTYGSLSSNKLEAIKRIWFLYRKVEKLNIIFSIYNFCFYAVNAVRRRI